MPHAAIRLTDAGMSEAAAARTARRLERLSDALDDLSDVARANGAGEPLTFWVPGRIEVLGKHTDYGGGRSLLCAVERGLCIVARARDDRTLRVRDRGTGAVAECELSPDVASTPGRWSNYPITVACRVATNFPGPLVGADICFDSDLPSAAGLSSSSALLVSIFLVLSAINDLPATPEYRENIHGLEDLGGYLGSVENGLHFKALRGHAGVGTFGGSEDHTAILCSRPGSLVQYSFCPVAFERLVPVPAGHDFVIGASGVLAEKSGAALEHYNRVSRRLRVGLEHWRQATGRADVSMGAAVASSPEAVAQIRELLTTVRAAEYSSRSLLDRFEQFVAETNAIIPAAGDALARGDVRSFGEMVALSQRGAEHALENQVPETVALVHLALEHGAVAASAFGAGFGGSVWALVASSSAASFRRAWEGAYRDAFPRAAARSSFFRTPAGPAAMRL